MRPPEQHHELAAIPEKMACLSCCHKQKLKRGLWSPEEDEKLVRFIAKHGHGCWSAVPKLAGLQRCGKSCRLRWMNYLRPDLKRGAFSEEEENLIIELHSRFGNRWSQIATKLPGRTDNEIKNFWNSCIKKKLKQCGIDPTTHKPVTTEKGVPSAASQSNLPAMSKGQYEGRPSFTPSPMGSPFLHYNRKLKGTNSHSTLHPNSHNNNNNKNSGYSSTSCSDLQALTSSIASRGPMISESASLPKLMFADWNTSFPTHHHQPSSFNPILWLSHDDAPAYSDYNTESPGSFVKPLFGDVWTSLYSELTCLTANARVGKLASPMATVINHDDPPCSSGNTIGSSSFSGDQGTHNCWLENASVSSGDCKTASLASNRWITPDGEVECREKKSQWPEELHEVVKLKDLLPEFCTLAATQMSRNIIDPSQSWNNQMSEIFNRSSTSPITPLLSELQAITSVLDDL